MGLPPIQQHGVSDFSVVGDMGRSLGQFSKVFTGVAAKLQERNERLAKTTAVREGVLAGLADDGSLRKGTRPQDEAYNNALILTRSNRVEVGLRSKLAELEDTYSSEPETFKVASDEVISEARNTLFELSPQHGEELRNKMDLLRLGAQRRIQLNSFKVLRSEAGASIVELENNITQHISSRAMDLFSPDPQLQEMALAEIQDDWVRLEVAWASPDPSGEGPLIDPENLANRRSVLLDKIYESGIRAFILNSENPGEIGEAILDGSFKIPQIGGEDEAVSFVSPMEELPQRTVESLIGLARTQQGRLDSEGRNARTNQKTYIGFKIDAIRAEIEGGQLPTLDLTFDEALTFTDDPLSAAMLVHTLNMERKIAVESQLINGESVEETHLRLAGIEVKGLDAPTDLSRLKTVQLALNQKTKALSEDPVNFAISSSPAVQETLQKYTGGDASELDFRRILLDEQKRLAKGMFGFRPRILSNGEVADIITTRAGIEQHQELVEFVTAQQMRFGPLTEQVLGELVPKGFPRTTAALMGLDSRSNGATLLARAIQMDTSDLNKGLDPDDLKGLQVTVNDQLRAFELAIPNGNDLVVATTRDGVELLAKAYMRFEKDFSGKPGDAAIQAADDILWSQWAVSSEVLIPKAFEEDERIIEAITPRSYEQIIDEFAKDIDPRLSSGGDPLVIHLEYVDVVKENGRFVPSEDLSGLELTDGRRPVYLASGEKFKITWDELRERGEKRLVSRDVASVQVGAGQTVSTEDIAERRKNRRKALEREKQLAFDTQYEKHDFGELERLIRDGFNPNDLTAQEVSEFKRERAVLFGELLDAGFAPSVIQRMSIQELRKHASDNK